MQTVFIAGMPRCGSMWTYNITRSLITASGHTLIPETALVDETELLEELSSYTPPNVDFCCIKTHHAITPLDDDRVKIICNYRDVRDAVLSFKRFTHCTDEEAIEAAKGMMQITDHYCNLKNQDSILKLRYENLINEPYAIAKSINQFLGLRVSEKDIQKIIQEFSRKRVEKKLNFFKISKFQALMKYLDKRSSFYELVENYDGSYRLFHKLTGFQSNHITDTKTGEWQEVFSPEKQKVLINLTSNWLDSYGYSIKSIEPMYS